MEIRQLVLRHYGKFENHTINLKPGINIIYGGNEAGKSTIHSFIRSMFFGLSRGRGKGAKTSQYQIRQPWDSPGAFMGSMRVEEQGEIYRIDRCFDRSREPLLVTCETQAREMADPQQALDTLLGGISEAAFVNTVFIPQTRSETGEALADELRRYMVNSDSGLDAQLDVSRALESLRKKKKQLEQKKKKEEQAVESQIEKRQAKAELLREELELLKRRAGMGDMETVSGQGSYRAGNRQDQTGRALYGGNASQDQAGRAFYGGNDSQGRMESEPRSWDNTEEDGDGREKSGGLEGRILEILFFLAGVGAFLGAFLLSEWKLKVFLGIFGGIFWLSILLVHFLLRRDRQDREEEETEIQEEAADPYLMEEIRKREEAYRKLQGELEELYHSHVGPDGADTEIAALSLAIDRICQLSSGIYARSGGWLNQRASGILGELTGGRYNRIVLDETAEVRIHTPSRVLGLHQVSGGTMEQIYFALRMAAGELLTQGRPLPVVLDETFAMYDDARLEAALRWLKNSGRQVILFTCQNREREILKRIE